MAGFRPSWGYMLNMCSLLQRIFPALLLTSLYAQKAGSNYLLNLSEKASPRIPPKPQNIVHPQPSILPTSVILKPLFHQQTVSLSMHNSSAVQWIQQITCLCILYHSFPLSYFETNCSQHLDLSSPWRKPLYLIKNIPTALAHPSGQCYSSGSILFPDPEKDVSLGTREKPVNESIISLVFQSWAQPQPFHKNYFVRCPPSDFLAV